MNTISLCIMTRELCHEFYKEYENDPSLYMDMSGFSKYCYHPEKVDSYFDKQQVANRIVYSILLDNKPIGELKLKNIDYDKKECTLGIILQNDSVKGKGYGKQAELLAIDLAFHQLNMKRIYADAVQKNVRSQHVLEKVGFKFIREDDMFKYYICER